VGKKLNTLKLDSEPDFDYAPDSNNQSSIIKHSTSPIGQCQSRDRRYHVAARPEWQLLALNTSVSCPLNTVELVFHTTASTTL